MAEAPLLSVRGLRTVFRAGGGAVVAVDDVSFDVAKGETLGIVGESGSGKSVTQLSLLGLLPSPPARIEAGSAMFEGQDLLRLGADALRRLRGNRVAMIFQDPMTCLNPFLRVSTQLAEVLEAHTDLPPRTRLERAVEMLRLVGIPDPEARVHQYPHQFSGGMRQRVMIAMALMCSPKLLIADEPTTALDVTIQAQILDLLRRLRREQGMSIVLITHDLGVVAGMADRVLVMYAGNFVEEAPVAELFARPQHPYTMGLLRSVPRVDSEGREPLVPIAGQPPDLANKPAGCPFAPRCVFALPECSTKRPDVREVSPGHRVRCHRPEAAEWYQQGLTAPPTEAA